MYEILRSLHHILCAVVAVLFCWVPVAMGTYDALRRDRGTLTQCISRDWELWWEVYYERRDMF